MLFFDIWVYYWLENVVYLLFLIFKEFGFDVVGFGNYEFNYGFDYLLDIIVDVEMLVLVGNVMIFDGDLFF